MLHNTVTYSTYSCLCELLANLERLQWPTFANYIRERVLESVLKAPTPLRRLVDDAVNELEGIDLTDPDLHKAATKIQASFRGHKVRQDVDIPKK
ncbi:hypothetical protein PV327_008213 [Microctonus hyperodae]|uniref:Uncharacterized protein n=1 Tax=Microctonus hyperodae TaxID=165561 RepID=A0AA39KGS5_MICHY|nr:hypothetical protein PV327_008213 [Microctonus hyperodae]